MKLKNILEYLSALETHNQREWYHANKTQLQNANHEFENLIQSLIFEIGKTDAIILHNEAQKLTFKLVRDTRFSHDKSPYNPTFRAHISSKGKLPIPVGYFIAIKPNNRSFLGGGLFANMFKDATTMVRDFIAAHGTEWNKIITSPSFTKYFSVKGEALKNVPRGYDSNHPQAEYLKNKTWYIDYPITDEQILDENFISFATEIFTAMQAFNNFLNRALQDFGYYSQLILFFEIKSYFALPLQKKLLVATEIFLKHKILKGVPQEGESRGENCGLHNLEQASLRQFSPFEKVLIKKYKRSFEKKLFSHEQKNICSLKVV